MIYEPQAPQEELSLFAQPEQLLQLKEQLLLLLQRNQNCRYYPNFQTNKYQLNDPQIRQNEEFSALVDRLQESQQFISDLTTQMSTLGEIAVKMIDYITQMHQKRAQEALRHDNEVQILKGQLQFATQKNNLIEGDIELFRERLIVVQTEMEEIQKSQLQKEINLMKDFQSQRKIELLQMQLQKIKENLSACKSQYTHKETDLSQPQRFMRANLSEKQFQLKRRHTLVVNNASIPQELVESLRQKIRMLQNENEILRYQSESLKEAYQNCVNQIPDQFHENFNIVQQDKLEQIVQVPRNSPRTFAKVTSSSFLKSPVKQEQQLNAQYLTAHQSVQRFHTLSNQWSTKSFQVNLAQLNADSHLNNLIYLNNEEQEKFNLAKNRIPETKETQNSLPDSEDNLMEKCHKRVRFLCEKQVNTKTWTELKVQFQTQRIPMGSKEFLVERDSEIKLRRQIQGQSVENASSPLNKTFKRLVNSFFNLKERAVDKRISKAMHQPKMKKHNRNKSYC